jgi:tetratricopeptide (TPR) repeat protein
LSGAEPLLAAPQTAAAYAAALERWPNDELVLFAAAGHKLGARDLLGATALYRQLLAAAPQHAAARNNLANVLADRGCYADALREARTALATIDATNELYAAISSTVAELERSTDTAVAAASCP